APPARSAKFPLSFAQQRLWFLDSLLKESQVEAAYNIPMAWKLTGSLNVKALEKALTQLVTRHEVLRTVFKSEEGQVQQVILSAASAQLTIRDITQEGDKNTFLQQALAAESEQGFDLSQGPLWRGGLLKLSKEEHVFYLTLH